MWGVVVDQPAGTGYSFVNTGDDVRELAQVGETLPLSSNSIYEYVY